MNVTTTEFLAPKLTGKRFQDHAIPLELLEDFAAFEELLLEVAKLLYLEENIDRKRVSKGFTKGISLKLSSIENGSAIPKIILVATSTGLYPNENYPYFEKAKDNIIRAIDAAENNLKISDYLPDEVLGYFNRIGKRLKDDEAIDFSPNSGLNAKLTKATRKKIILSSSNIQEITSETSIRGTIPEADKSKSTFTLSLINGQRITAPIEKKHSQIILDAFNNYESGCKVFITGIGRFNRNDKLESIEQIEQISILEPLDVPARLEEISILQNGWFNGEGIAPKKEWLTWFEDVFESNYDSLLPLPCLFPTIEGGIQAEWNIKEHDLTLKIDFTNKTAFYHSLNLKNDETEEMTLNLNNELDWQKLNDRITNILNA